MVSPMKNLKALASCLKTKTKYHFDNNLTPDVWFDGTIVWEVLYYTLLPSTTHSAGISLGTLLDEEELERSSSDLEIIESNEQSVETASNTNDQENYDVDNDYRKMISKKEKIQGLWLCI